MATRKGTIAMNADFTQLASAVGALEGMVATVKTDRFLTPLVESTHVALANTFDAHMSLIAEANPQRFHHVYEWRLTGDVAGQLWTHQLKGRGSSNRFASWAWKASKTPILTPEERAEDPNDPMHYLSSKKVDSFNDRSYFFIWKAPVMEYNQAVTIKPKYAKEIAFPSGIKLGKIVGMNKAVVANPGGEETTLAFTTEWTRWWNTVAPAIFDDTIGKTLKKGIEDETLKAVKRGSRKASVGISTMTYKSAEAQGRKWAAANLNQFAAKKSADMDWYEPEAGI